VESGRLAQVLLAGRPAVQRARAASGGLRKAPCYDAHMMNSRMVVESLNSSDLRSATRELVRRSHGLEVELLVHLAEIDERKLYLDWAFSSMFAFCVGELGFSEDVACSRINVARAARRMPVILDVLRTGRVHLAGLRLLAPHLTTENQQQVLARRPASRSARSKSWSPVFHRSHRFRRSCASSRTAAIPRPSHRHSRSATPSRWRRPSRRLLLRWYRKARPRRDAMNAGPWSHRSLRTPSSFSSPRVARVVTSSARPRICFDTESRTETWR